jgi:hypothetical protein
MSNCTTEKSNMKDIVIRELNDLVVAIEGGITKRTTRQSLKALLRWMKATRNASWINTIVPKEKTTFGEIADELAKDCVRSERVGESQRDDIIADAFTNWTKRHERTKYTENIETPAMDRLDALEVHRDRILHEMGVAQHDIHKLNTRVTTITKEVIPKLKATRASNAKKGK